MSKLAVADLMPLEQYARERPGFRTLVLQHKALRQLPLGNCTRLFEDRLTRCSTRCRSCTERTSRRHRRGRLQSADPDGSNWKVTLLLRSPAGAPRRASSGRRGPRCYVQVSPQERVLAIADEDLPRENAEKTSAVHFLRFELQPRMIQELRAGAPLAAGIDHEHYRHQVQVPAPVRQALLADLA
jgi:hypothetical protein